MGKCIIIGAGACDTKLLDQRLVVKNEDLCIAAIIYCSIQQSGGGGNGGNNNNNGKDP